MPFVTLKLNPRADMDGPGVRQGGEQPEPLPFVERNRSLRLAAILVRPKARGREGSR